MKPVGTQLKRLFKASPFTLAIVVFPLASLAIEVKDVPNPQQLNGTWVTDMAGILSDDTETQLNQMIAQLERKNGAEVTVVTVPETAPAASPKDFTTKLFNYWGIGKKGKDNGVLLLISKGDRRVEIETGYGIEGILPDAKVGNIINTQITPQFKKGDFNGGTVAGTKALVVALEAPQPSSANQEPTPTAIASGTPNTLLEDQPSAGSQHSQTLTQDTNSPWGVIVGGGLLLAIGTAALKSRRVFRQVFIEPEGRSRFSSGNRVCLCAQCKQRMEKVDDSIIQSTLSKPEKVAQQLSSVRFEGWKCPNCSQQLTGLGFHRVAYQSRSGRFYRCPTCQELTLTSTNQIVQHPTEYSSGKRLVIDKCHCCSYGKQKEETLPLLPPPPPPPPPSSSGSDSNWWSSSGSSSSGSYSDGGSSGGSSSSGSYSDGGSSSGSFGGGDSGGGGAGGSW